MTTERASEFTISEHAICDGTAVKVDHDMNDRSSNIITIELDDRHALALAQFVKRVGWTHYRDCAVDDDEARAIGEAIATLQRELAEKGWAPR